MFKIKWKTTRSADLSEAVEQWTVNRKLINILWRATLGRCAAGGSATRATRSQVAPTLCGPAPRPSTLPKLFLYLLISICHNNLIIYAIRLCPFNRSNIDIKHLTGSYYRCFVEQYWKIFYRMELERTKRDLPRHRNLQV